MPVYERQKQAELLLLELRPLLTNSQSNRYKLQQLEAAHTSLLTLMEEARDQLRKQKNVVQTAAANNDLVQKYQILKAAYVNAQIASNVLDPLDFDIQNGLNEILIAKTAAVSELNTTIKNFEPRLEAIINNPCSTLREKLLELKKLSNESTILHNQLLALQEEDDSNLNVPFQKCIIVREHIQAELEKAQRPFSEMLDNLISSLKTLHETAHMSPEGKIHLAEEYMENAQDAWKLLDFTAAWEDQPLYYSAHKLAVDIISQNSWVRKINDCMDLISPVASGAGSVDDKELNLAAVHYFMARLFELLTTHPNDRVCYLADRVRNHLLHCQADIKKQNSILKELAYAYRTDREALKAECVDSDPTLLIARIEKYFVVMKRDPKEHFKADRKAENLYKSFKEALMLLRKGFSVLQEAMKAHERPSQYLALQHHADVFASMKMATLTIVELCSTSTVNSEELKDLIVTHCHIGRGHLDRLLNTIRPVRNEAAHGKGHSEMHVGAGAAVYSIEEEISPTFFDEGKAIHDLYKCCSKILPSMGSFVVRGLMDPGMKAPRAGAGVVSAPAPG